MDVLLNIPEEFLSPWAEDCYRLIGAPMPDVKKSAVKIAILLTSSRTQDYDKDVLDKLFIGMLKERIANA